MDITSDSSAYKLIATVRKNSNGVQKFVDYGVLDADSVYYVVTAPISPNIFRMSG